MKTRRWGGANKNERMRSGGWKREDEGNEKIRRWQMYMTYRVG
jgi:hypothetical protein